VNLNDAYMAFTENPSDETKETFGKSLMAYCKGLLTENASKDTDDAVGEALLLVWSKLDMYKPTYPFATWARKVIFNKEKDLQRKRIKQAEVALEDVHDDGGNWVNDNFARMSLKELVSQLPKEDQFVIQLYRQGYTLNEIGAKLGVSKQAINQNFSRRIIPKLKELAGVESPGTQPA
jgi:RNA polymerase sigma factor (sigma-70 family)